MQIPEEILKAVLKLSEDTGLVFEVLDVPVQGTNLYVVFVTNHPFPDRYTVSSGVLGFRVPNNFPNACPEDCFFIQPHDTKLREPDKTRNSTDIHRASKSDDFLKGTKFGNSSVLVFSWHIWNTLVWDRKKHSLSDHYFHCLRRFEVPEHD